MARVLFTDRFVYVPSAARHVTKIFKAGRERTVKRECARAAVEAGAAIEVPPPPRARAGADPNG